MLKPLRRLYIVHVKVKEKREVAKELRHFLLLSSHKIGFGVQ